MNQPTVSIIATFYNQSKYAPRLIKSVINQTFTDWELICINDCSKDNTNNVLSKFGEKCKKISIISNETNLGPSKSRHIGIEKAIGEYLAFIDGDDWIDQDYLETLVTTAIKDNLDMVICNAKRAIPLLNIRKKVVYLPRLNKVFEKPQIMDTYFLNFFGIHFFMPGYWSKLIRKSVIEKCGFEPIGRNYCEDEQFLMTLWPHLNRIEFIGYNGYCWRWGTGVTSYQSGKKRKHYVLDNYFDYYNFKKDQFEKYNYEKARYHLLNEFKCVIRDCIDVKYPLGHPIAEEEIVYLKSVLSHQEIDDLKLLLQNKKSPLTEVILSKDPLKIYEYIRSVSKRGGSLARLKNISMSLLSMISSKIP